MFATTLRLFVALIACLCRSGVKKQICTNRTEKRNKRRGLVCRGGGGDADDVVQELQPLRISRREMLTL